MKLSDDLPFPDRDETNGVVESHVCSKLLNNAPQTQDSWASDGAFLSEIIETQSDLAAIELDLPTIRQIVAERTQRLTRADAASVKIIEGEHLICCAASGMLATRVGARVSIAASLSGQVAKSGQYAYCADTAADDRVDTNMMQRLGIRSFIDVPIRQGAQIVGVLSVSSRSPRAFKQRDISAVRLMAGLVAAAISHAAEFETKKRLLAQRTSALVALRESEARFRNAFDHAAIGMALVAPDGRWLQVNRSICQIVGYTEHELLVRDFQSITHPDDLNADLAQANRLLAGEIQDYQMVKRYIHRQGHIVWVLLSVSLVRDIEGKPVHFISQIQDITRRKETEDALRASENEYRTTFEMAGIGKAQVELPSGRFIRVNRKLCEMLGYSAEELTSLSFAQVTHPEDAERCQNAAIKMALGEQKEFSVDKRFIRKDGRMLWVTLNATTITDADGRPVRAVSTFQDVTERRLGEQLERDRRKVLEMVARDMPLTHVLGQLAASVETQIGDSVAGIFVLEDGNIKLHGPHLPPAWSKALISHGLRLAAALASSAWHSSETCGVTVIADNEIWKDLRPIAVRHNIAACWTTPIQGMDNAPLGLLMTFSRTPHTPTIVQTQTLDMAAKLGSICIEHHDTTRKLSHLVRHDSLTGLANRIMYEDRLQHAIDLASRSGNGVGLLVLDIDRFKSINDTYGHQVGDQLLQQFAHRLQGLLRDADTMARLGGDEFVVVLPETKNQEATIAVARKLIGCLAEPFVIDQVKVVASTSIGIAIFPQDGQSGVRLQKQADDALYRAKQNGRNTFAF